MGFWNENIVRFAQENNLNMNQFIDCNNELKYQNLITNSNSDAQSLVLLVLLHFL